MEKRQLRKRRKKGMRCVFTSLAFIGAVAIAIHCFRGSPIVEDDNQRTPPTQETEAVLDLISYDEKEPESVNVLNFERARTYQDVNFTMSSQQAVLVNLDTNDVLFEQDVHARVYPASLTKIMTTLLGIIYAETDTMAVQADFDQLLLSNATVAGFSQGEVRQASEIFHGAMLPSGADATTTIAYHVGGTYDGFVRLMNEFAEEIGMENTNFMNASGLHHPNQYTTPYDMILLIRYALEHPTFRSVFKAESHPFVNWMGERQYMTSTLFSNLVTPEFQGGQILGGRTGFTTEAGRCLATLATNGESEFLLITFGATNYEENQRMHIVDAITIYEYFFD